MPNDQKCVPSEEDIRTRSYLLWERDGFLNGKSEMYWQRAKQELEANWHAASMAGETTAFVLPVLPISTPPSKTVSVKLDEDNIGPKKASG
jgi:hypothetical protein